MKTNADRRITSHALLGTTQTYRPNEEPYDASKDPDPSGTLILANGMKVHVVAAFYDWNGVKGLDMLYVFVRETGMSTHVTPKDLGWTKALQA